MITKVTLSNGTVAHLEGFGGFVFYSVYVGDERKYFVMFSDTYGRVEVYRLKKDGNFSKKKPSKRDALYYGKIMRNLIEVNYDFSISDNWLYY